MGCIVQYHFLRALFLPKWRELLYSITKKRKAYNPHSYCTALRLGGVMLSRASGIYVEYETTQYNKMFGFCWPSCLTTNISQSGSGRSSCSKRNQHFKDFPLQMKILKKGHIMVIYTDVLDFSQTFADWWSWWVNLDTQAELLWEEIT